MSVNKSAKYVKPGAVFANADEAYADKNSLYPPALIQAVDECYAAMLADGILLEPVSYTWDQETQILTVNKIVSSSQDYDRAITFSLNDAVTYSIQAGWSWVAS